VAAGDLVQDARKAWYEYGQAIVKAFHFPPDSRMVAEELEGFLSKASDDRIHRFIDYVRGQTAEIAQMKWIGED